MRLGVELMIAPFLRSEIGSSMNCLAKSSNPKIADNIDPACLSLDKIICCTAVSFWGGERIKHHCQDGNEDESQDDQRKVGFKGGDGAEEVASKDNQRSPGERF